jgi:small subunit ribosomal protein S8
MYINTIISIKNATSAGKETLRVPYTRTDAAVLAVLKQYGFITTIDVKGRSFRKIVDITLNPSRPIKGVHFLSTPSLRRYAGYADFKTVKGGNGLLVVSTSGGIMGGTDAKKARLGGQLLFTVWS